MRRRLETWPFGLWKGDSGEEHELGEVQWEGGRAQVKGLGGFAATGRRVSGWTVTFKRGDVGKAAFVATVTGAVA